MKPPFPWFGGKSRVSALVWERFGDVKNLVEPFFGSGTVLLNRPHWPFEETRIETANDLDCYLSNFWRALRDDPEQVAYYADWPVNEADLHARHWWLVRQDGFRAKMRTDPDYYDAKVAGWWVWGICQWIGTGWCQHPECQKRPDLGSAGKGVHRPTQQLPHLGDAGRGIHRPAQKLPHLGGAFGTGEQGIINIRRGDLREYMLSIAARLRYVRVCCGDWSRVLGPTPTTKHGLTGVFLDPPYSDARRDADLYSVDSMTIARDVAAWAIEHGDDPLMRIALCGYEGEHDMPGTWDCVAWKAPGGYSSQRKNGTNENPHLERVWFSPHCLQVNRMEQITLFSNVAVE